VKARKVKSKRVAKSPAVARLEKRVEKLDRQLARTKNEHRLDREWFVREMWQSSAPVPNLHALSPDGIRTALTCENMRHRECPLCDASLPEHGVRVDAEGLAFLCSESPGSEVSEERRQESATLQNPAVNMVDVTVGVVVDER
jgi:hypothetical protein